MRRGATYLDVCVLLALSTASLTCRSEESAVRFERDVAPVLARRCGASSCHGVPPGAHSNRDFVFATDSYGYLSSAALVANARTAALRFADTTERPEFSTLLRKPLPPELGGLVHGGGPAFRDRDDAAYIAVRDWIAHERGGGEDRDPASLTPGERFFADYVQPRLAQAQCMLAPCHGPDASIPLNFDPGFDGVFGVAATRANYEQSIVHLALGGWPEQSRLVRKVVRDPAAMIPHRGGNGINAFPATLDDPLAQAVMAWAQFERSARTGETTDHVLQGLVFVAGSIAASRVVEHTALAPGSDLFLLAPVAPGVTPRNLTEGLHSAPVEIRNPAVDDTGTRVAFSMRRSPDEGATIWELDLATNAPRQLTSWVYLPDGTPSYDGWPAYAPDGRIWFVSTRAGTLAEHADGFDTDLYVLESDGSITRRSHTPSPELATTFLRTGRETAGSVAFTAIRRLGEQYRGVVYRFPNDLHSEYHQHFGITIADDITFHLREMPDGTHVAVLLDRDAAWNAGALILLDRNLGPELSVREAATSSLPGFVHAVSFVGPYGSHDDEGNVRRETSNGAWRDPAPLPDGRVVASWASGPTSLRGGVPPDFALYALRFTRDRADHDATVATRELLVDLPGVSETEPVPVFRNVSIRPVPPAPQGPTGRLDHGGVPMLENILGRVGASGSRVARNDLRGVRLLEWIETTSDPSVPTIMPSLYGEQRRTGASPHMPARVLAEIPLESDGTFLADIPAGTAFRLQLLDADGMATGVQHNRWFDISGGQTLHQGLSSEAFDRACTHCHGSRSGEPADSFVPVDLTTRASLSLARMELDDPDRPRTPPLVGAATRLASEWRTVVAPVLARSCTAASCHSGATPASGLSLETRPTGRYDLAYESLATRGSGSANGFRYVDVIGATARGSFLVERIAGRELDAPRSIDGAAAHRGNPPLEENEFRSIVRWIESGALFCTEHCP